MQRLEERYSVGHYIDTYAMGHYARVLSAADRSTGATVAFKVMRPEHLLGEGEISWEYRAFANEAVILSRLEAVPNAIDLRDCGYVAAREDGDLSGDFIGFGQDVRGFVQAMTDHAARGWRPYLALEALPRAHNLFYLMKPTQPGARWRLPSEEGLALVLQFANLLRVAHQAGIVYLDHKLEHVYWDGVHLRVIDFNSSQLLKGEAGDSQAIVKDIHNLCVGVLYPIFTGMSPHQTTLRPQPGDRESVQTRYDDVKELDFIMEPLLSDGIKQLLQRGAAQQIPDVEAFFSEIQHAASAHGWDFPDDYTSPASRDARDQLRAGIRRLREGDRQIREARDLFRDALTLEGIAPDLEDELRRLAKAVNEMLARRVIP
jgi:serine/threonine protein kinase